MKHLARIGKVDKIIPIDGADFVQSAVVYGFNVIVSKNVQVGDLGVFFEATDIQLSDEYAKMNNLYRHSEYNSDVNAKGYLEDNRKLKVQKFLKTKSEGLFMSLDSLSYTGYDISVFKFGDSFDELNEHQICNKFYNAKTAGARNSNTSRKKNSTPLFHEHLDTEQLSYYIDSIPKGSLVTITSKNHGTSGRYSFTPVAKEVVETVVDKIYVPSLKRNIKKTRQIKKSVTDYEYVVGTRRVVLGSDGENKTGFHGSEKYRYDILQTLKPYLEKNMTIYLEIVGYVNGAPVMGTHDVTKLKDDAFVQKYGKKVVYKYGCMQDEFNICVYRISYTNPDGVEMDLSHSQMVDWCNKRNIPVVKTLVDTFVYDGNKDALFQQAVFLAENEKNLCEDYNDPSHICEGVVVRVDNYGLRPDLYKYKSFPFRVMEGIAKLKSDFIDVEDAS